MMGPSIFRWPFLFAATAREDAHFTYFSFMISSWMNWRSLMVFIAILIVSGTIVYSQYLAGKIATEERKNVAAWVEAQRTILYSSDTVSINLATKIITENDQIPIIETNENDQITGNYLNLDPIEVKKDKNYLANKLKQFKRFNRNPIISILSEKPYAANKYYYGESKLLQETQLYPIIQLLVVAFLFLLLLQCCKSITRVAKTSYGLHLQKKLPINWARQ